MLISPPTPTDLCPAQLGQMPPVLRDIYAVSGPRFSFPPQGACPGSLLTKSNELRPGRGSVWGLCVCVDIQWRGVKHEGYCGIASLKSHTVENSFTALHRHNTIGLRLVNLTEREEQTLPSLNSEEQTIPSRTVPGRLTTDPCYTLRL